MLTQAQIQQYERDGFLVIRDALDDHELNRFEAAYRKQEPYHGPVPGTYPEPGRYTLAKSCMFDPDLAFAAEHPNIVGPAGDLLGEHPLLTAFVVYDRTVNGPGIPSHNDYKRWRPVGSSMHWLFTIVPLCDFDEHSGQLFVSPGSHRLDRIRDDGGPTLEISPAVKPDEDSYVDPQLKRGDLCLMNMHCWHRAAPNKSNHSRIGFFNKYAAKSFPPATGYYMYTDAAYHALSEAGRKYVAVHSDKPIATTRLVLEKTGPDGSQYLLVDDGDGNLVFPGGPTWDEGAIPDWDLGNYVAPLHAAMRDTLKIETPWVSYVGDFDEGNHLSRVYAFQMNDNGFPVRYGGEWLSLDDVRQRLDDGTTGFGYEGRAIEDWKAPGITRGKAVSQAQARVDQYAY